MVYSNNSMDLTDTGMTQYNIIVIQSAQKIKCFMLQFNLFNDISLFSDGQINTGKEVLVFLETEEGVDPAFEFQILLNVIS